MNNTPYCKTFCRGVFLIGFAGMSATFGSVQAADIGMKVLSDPPVERSAKPTSTILEDSTTPLRGAQGPIRTESFSDLKPTPDGEMLRNDMELRRYPASSSAAIP